MSEETTKSSELSTDGISTKSMPGAPKTPNRNLDGLMMEELTRSEIRELAETFLKVEEMGIEEVRRSRKLDKHTPELIRISEAMGQYFDLMNHGGRLSSTMELVQYLMMFRSSNREG